jgi:glutathione S-transferase
MTNQLFGAPCSLYTSKARSYLIKQGIPFENRAAGDPAFREEIVPQIGRWIIPVLKTTDGTIIQDGSEIIAHFEAAGPTRFPAIPATPLHRIIGLIFELFGGEGMLRPAMHYRWNFDDVNRAFLEQDFPISLAPAGADAEMQATVFGMASNRMRAAMASFGVTAETIPAVEASYAEFLRRFNAHLKASPYLLGGRPSIGDYGLIAPLYAHLGRDPVPAQIMQRTAYRVWRWVERMHAPDHDSGEYGPLQDSLFENDGVPETLKHLLRFVAEDYLPEIEAFVAFTNTWLAAHPGIASGTNGLTRPGDRAIGQTTFTWRGHAITVGVMPYRLYLLQKVQDAADEAAPDARAAIDALLGETGLSALLTVRACRRVVRRAHWEVWA